MTAIFFLPGTAMLACFVLFGAATYGFARLALGMFERRATAMPASIPVAPYFTAITSAWALSLGFAAADIWSVRADAQSYAVAERSAITRLAGMAAGNALDVPAILAGLAQYREGVLEDEWGNSSQHPSSDVEGAIQDIRLAIISLAREGTPPSLVENLTRDFDELQDARNLRLANAESSVSEYKWYLLLFLTVLSTIAIASVHADRPAAGRSALAIYIVAATVSLWILAIHANPYDGMARIDLEPVQLPLQDR